MTFRTVLFDRLDSIAYVTLNRPAELNAYNVQMRDDLYEVFTAVRDDPDTRAMILSGTGKAFCAGADLVADNAFIGNERSYRPARRNEKRPGRYWPLGPYLRKGW